MYLRFSRLALLASFCFFLVQSAIAEPGPTPLPTPWEPPTPTVPPVSPPTGPDVEEVIPVVISYGEGLETRASISQGLMQPVGVPREQSVTVTLLLLGKYAGQPLALGLYDGGQVGAVTLPGQDMITFTNPGVPLPIVSADGKAQFNFRAGANFGLYRLLVTIGPNQFLLQFHAVAPRPLPVAIASPHPTVSPSPLPSPRPITTPKPSSIR